MIRPLQVTTGSEMHLNSDIVDGKIKPPAPVSNQRRKKP